MSWIEEPSGRTQASQASASAQVVTDAVVRAPIAVLTQGETLPVKNLAEAAADEVVHLTELLGPGKARALVVEPASAVGQALRDRGFMGELVALTHRPLAEHSLLESIYDQVVVYDWRAASADQASAKIGEFDIVVALDLSGIALDAQSDGETMGTAGVVGIFGQLTTWARPQGYIVYGASGATGRHPEAALLEPALIDVGLLLAGERHFDEDWVGTLTRWQYRPGKSSRGTGVLERAPLAELEADSQLREEVFTTYRDVFGGDEWGEWMRCTRPGCGRHYSQSEYEQLDPAGQCVCGWSEPLTAFHASEDILALMRHDLADDVNSRLYISHALSESVRLRSVNAFIWGYLADAEHVAQGLTLHEGDEEQERLRAVLLDQLERIGAPNTATSVYHQAFIGIRQGMRNFSLLRSLFARMCGFALDRGTQLVVTVTIPTITVYPLLRSIGMEVIYSYPALSKPSSRPTEQGGAKDAADVQEQLGALDTTWHERINYDEAPSHLDTQGVLLAGSVKSLLAILSNESDSALMLRVARYLRHQQQQ